MGIFEKVLQEHGPETLTLTPHQAFVAIVVGTASVDGGITPEEAARINQLFGATRLFRPPTGEPLQPVLGEVMGLIERHGADRVVALAAKALPPPLRAPAFAVAVDLVLADGEAGAEERKFIDDLQARLQIPDEVAMKIVDVLLVKNSA
jgi:hypothetical protein